MGLALLVLIWVITLASTYFFVAKTWWLPVGAAASAGFIDRQFTITFILMGIVFLAASSRWGTSSGNIASSLRLRRFLIPTATRRSKSFGLYLRQCSSSD